MRARCAASTGGACGSRRPPVGSSRPRNFSRTPSSRWRVLDLELREVGLVLAELVRRVGLGLARPLESISARPSAWRTSSSATFAPISAWWVSRARGDGVLQQLARDEDAARGLARADRTFQLLASSSRWMRWRDLVAALREAIHRLPHATGALADRASAPCARSPATAAEDLARATRRRPCSAVRRAPSARLLQRRAALLEADRRRLVLELARLDALEQLGELGPHVDEALLGAGRAAPRRACGPSRRP
jgi:hypothetical protein